MVARLFLYLILNLPAFHGAQGAGAKSRGGRGGVVLQVTNLENSGTGSLRWAIEENSGPRTIVFRVSGIITLNWPIRIDSPYVTIAGQTSPGGIVIKGEGMDYALFEIRTHDVIMRYLRIRPGHRAPDCSAIRIDDFDDADSIYNIILDHLSISWNTDEGIDMWGPSSVIDGITVQNSLLAEPLKVHPTTILTGGNTSEDAESVRRIDFHHNLIMNTGHRNPLVKTPLFRFINNIVYNWYFYATQIIGGVSIDIISNKYVGGPIDTTYHYHSVEATEAYNTDAIDGIPSIYISGNIGPYNPYPDSDNWIMVQKVSGENGNEEGQAPAVYRRDTALSYADYEISINAVNDLENIILDNVGASSRLDEYGNLVPSRDSVDLRLIQEYYNGGGFVPDSEEVVGGYPVIPSCTPYPDNDGDGMSDVWEELVGLDPDNPDDRNGTDLSPEGYTNLEVFLDGTMGVNLKEERNQKRNILLFSGESFIGLSRIPISYPAHILLISEDGRMIENRIVDKKILTNRVKRKGIYYLLIKPSSSHSKIYRVIIP